MRRSCKLPRLKRATNEKIQPLMRVEKIIDETEKRFFQWHGHVKRMKEQPWSRKDLSWQPLGNRRR
jgi:hypothetical protein